MYGGMGVFDSGVDGGEEAGSATSDDSDGGILHVRITAEK